MKITTISYGRTFNNGNFESSRIDISVEVEAKEEPEDVFVKLFDKVETMRNIELEELPPQRGRK